LPAFAGDKTTGPARWTTGDSTSAQRKATLTKEINAAYAEQQTQCQRQGAAKRARCLTAARTTYQHDLAAMPRLLADAPAGGISERVVSTTAGAATTPVARGANAVGSSGSTGTSGSGSTDAIAPAAAQSGGVPPPVDQPDPAQPTQPPQGVPPTQQQ
jgi:hypothetical protein